MEKIFTKIEAMKLLFKKRSVSKEKTTQVLVEKNHNIILADFTV